MTVHMMADRPPAGTPERGTFGVAFVLALVLELVAVLALGVMPAAPPPEQPEEVAPVHIHAAELPAPPPPEPPPPEPPPPEPPPPAPPPPAPEPPPPPEPAPPPPAPEPPPPPPKAPPRPVTPPRHPPVPRPAEPVAPAIEAPPTPAVPAVSAAVEANVTAVYAAALRARVQANLVVPSVVRMLGRGGISRVAIKLAPNGALLAVTLTGPSGSSEIDEAALKSVRGSQFPPFPTEMQQHPMTFALTVRITP